nr:MAG: 52 kDa protein [unidentified adenovirus]
MHPALRQTKALMDTYKDYDEGRGIASNVVDPSDCPQVRYKAMTSDADIHAENILRDGEERESVRHNKFESGRLLTVDSTKILEPKDFEISEDCCLSTARQHLEAADLKTAYEQTVVQEVNHQKSFNNRVRTLLSREELIVGTMYLWDFVEAYCENPKSKALNTQLLLIAQHCSEDSILQDSLLSISESESKWLLDLINILQAIIVQERRLTLDEKVAAINYSVVTLGKHYAKKIFKTPFVPIDKEVKIDTFYMRLILRILKLCNDLGVYRNLKMERVLNASQSREMSDAELIASLCAVMRNPEGSS